MLDSTVRLTSAGPSWIFISKFPRRRDSVFSLQGKLLFKSMSKSISKSVDKSNRESRRTLGSTSLPREKRCGKSCGYVTNEMVVEYIKKFTDYVDSEETYKPCPLWQSLSEGKSSYKPTGVRRDSREKISQNS